VKDMREKCSRCGWTRGRLLDAALAISLGGVFISDFPKRCKHLWKKPSALPMADGSEES